MSPRIAWALSLVLLAGCAPILETRVSLHCANGRAEHQTDAEAILVMEEPPRRPFFA